MQQNFKYLYKITLKEVGRDLILHPSYYGNKTEEEVIEFFGLKEPDIEWYYIEKFEGNLRISG